MAHSRPGIFGHRHLQKTDSRQGRNQTSIDRSERAGARNHRSLQVAVILSFDTKLPFSRLSSVPEVFHHDADLVGMETEKRVLMDWDWKREPRPDYEDRILEGVPLLFFETKPWKNMKQFCDRRENWTKWSHGRGRVLKNSRDYEDFLEYEIIQSQLPTEFRRGSLKDICVRLFARAYVTNSFGLTRSYTDSELAGLLSAAGFRCTSRSIEHARLLGRPERYQILPRNNSTVERFRGVIKRFFPAFDFTSLLQFPGAPAIEYRDSEVFVEFRVNQESFTLCYPEREWDVELEMLFAFERELESTAEPLQAAG